MSDQLRIEIAYARKNVNQRAKQLQAAQGMYASAEAWLDHLLRLQEEEEGK